MTVREILKMGDPRLLRIAQPVTAFDTPELHELVADMFDTMKAAQGAGLAAPQIGVDLQLVIFGFSQNARYPDRPAVPTTVLLNPVITPPPLRTMPLQKVEVGPAATQLSSWVCASSAWIARGRHNTGIMRPVSPAGSGRRRLCRLNSESGR